MKEIKRLHYSRDKKIEFRDIVDVNADNFKPRGLWYSINDAWMQWVMNEQPDWLVGYPYVRQLELNHDRILTIPGNVASLRDLIARYGVPFGHGGGLSDFRCIDWGQIAEEYAGVEFYPYNRHLVMNSFYGKDRAEKLTTDEIFTLTFYSGVDVPSGCIWHEDGIKSFSDPVKQDVEKMQALAEVYQRRWMDDDDDDEDPICADS